MHIQQQQQLPCRHVAKHFLNLITDGKTKSSFLTNKTCSDLSFSLKGHIHPPIIGNDWNFCFQKNKLNYKYICFVSSCHAQITQFILIYGITMPYFCVHFGTTKVCPHSAEGNMWVTAVNSLSLYHWNVWLWRGVWHGFKACGRPHFTVECWQSVKTHIWLLKGE